VISHLFAENCTGITISTGNCGSLLLTAGTSNLLISSTARCIFTSARRCVSSTTTNTWSSSFRCSQFGFPFICSSYQRQTRELNARWESDWSKSEIDATIHRRIRSQTELRCFFTPSDVQSASDRMVETHAWLPQKWSEKASSDLGCSLGRPTVWLEAKWVRPPTHQQTRKPKLLKQCDTDDSTVSDAELTERDWGGDDFWRVLSE